MNAAQRRRARRQLMRDWPKGLIVTSRSFDGCAHVVGYSSVYQGAVMVKGARGKELTLYPRHMRPAPIAPVGKAFQAVGDAAARALPKLQAMASTFNSIRGDA